MHCLSGLTAEKEIIPENTISKPPSAELRPNQKDSDSLPDYAIIDNVLQAYMVEHHSEEVIAKSFGYPLDLVKDLVLRIHRNEYKRRQSPPGLRISEKAFSVGRRFPHRSEVYLLDSTLRAAVATRAWESSPDGTAP